MAFSFSKRKYEITLFVILIVAFLLRVSTARFKYLLIADPWYHYFIAKQYLETGIYPIYNFHDNYPIGSFLLNHPPGLTYFPFWFYKILGLFGISFFKTFQILPSIFGTLCVFPIFLISSKIFNKTTGLYASFLYAVSFGALERSFAGNYRGDVFMLFFMLSAFYFFILAYKTENKKKLFLYSLISGIFLFFCGIVWGGWHFAFIALSIAFLSSVIFSYFENKDFSKKILSYSITMLVGIALLFLFQKLFFSHYLKLGNLEILDLQMREISTVIYNLLLFFAFSTFLYFSDYLSKSKKTKFFLLAVFLMVAALIIMNLNLYEKFTDFPITGFVFREDEETKTIKELYDVNYQNLSFRLNILLLIAPLGVVLKREKFLWGWLFAVSTLTYFALRFVFLAIPILSIYGGVFLNSLQNMKQKNITLPMVFFLLFFNTYSTLKILPKVQPMIGDEWYDSLEWMRKNTPEDSVVLAWWDYTPWILGISERNTLASFGMPQGLSPDEYSLFLDGDFSDMKDKNINYIIIDNRTASKFYYIKKFAKRDVKFEDSLIYKFYLENPPQGFELIHKNEDVKIFELKYEKKIDANLEKVIYKSFERLEFQIQLKKGGILRIKIYDSSWKLVFDDMLVNVEDLNFSWMIPNFEGRYFILIDYFFPKLPPFDEGHESKILNFFVSGRESSIDVDSNVDATFTTLKITGSTVKNAKVIIYHGLEFWETSTDENGDFYLKTNWKPIYGENFVNIFVLKENLYGVRTLKFDANFKTEVVDFQYFDGEWKSFDETPKVKAGESLKLRFRVKANFKPLENDRIRIEIKDVKNPKPILDSQFVSKITLEANSKSNYYYLDLIIPELPEGKYFLLIVVDDSEEEGIYFYFDSEIKYEIIIYKRFINSK